jgi:transposase
MTKITMFIGLDCHQSGIQVCVMDRLGKVLANRKCENDWRAVAAIVAPWRGEVHAAIEACSGAADLADQLVQEAGWSVDLAHPGYMARIKQSPDKTDYGDAQLLADLERVGYVPRVWHAPEMIRELRRLVRYRQQLVARRRNAKLRVQALLRDHRLACPGVRPWTKCWMAWLCNTDGLPDQSHWILQCHLAELRSVAEQIREVEQRLETTTSEDKLVGELQKLRGVGLVTAVSLLAEIGRFDRFRSGKQLARFCGVSPRNASSGTRQADAGLVKAGNPELRRVLTEAAHRLVRYDDRWLAMSHRLQQQEKRRCVVIAAVANRWVRSLYHQFQAYGLAS